MFALRRAGRVCAGDRHEKVEGRCVDRARCGGWLMLELLAALGVVIFAVLPIAYSFASEKRLARSQYQRAVAMQIVDGEFELLAAGGWRSLQPGQHEYKPSGWAVSNMSAGRMEVEISTNRIRLQWAPEKGMRGGSVTREMRLP